VGVPDTRYAKTTDGVYIAYQTVGDGPIDLVWQFDWLGNVDTIWGYRPSAEWFRGLASFSRLILHDRRGTGASSRNVDPPNLETRVADLTVVLDAVGSERPVLGGALEGGAPNILFAATFPERVETPVEPLDLAAGLILEFSAPDEEAFPCLALARAAGEAGRTAPCVLNAANEVAVATFLDGRLPFPAIAEVVEGTLNATNTTAARDLDELVAMDAEARKTAAALTRELVH